MNTPSLPLRGMTRKPIAVALSPVAFVALGVLGAPATALAQQSEAVLEEVTVTARRTGENPQDIPVSMQVVSGDLVENMILTKPSEISILTPGLNIELPTPGQPAIILRGVRWTQASGTPAIPIYLNEVSFDPVQVLQTMYDVGQIEVLRGPQGTLRGAPSISGAVTITTRRPVLNEFGGYALGLLGTDGHEGIQGAINLPIMDDKLAVRLAGNFENSEANQVHSVNSSQDPSNELQTWRASLLFQPTDTISINAMYQQRHQDIKFFDQLSGSGSPGNPAKGIPANFNGPAISTGDYNAVAEDSVFAKDRTDLYTVNATWDVLGQTLSYNYGRQETDNNGGSDDLDTGNLVPGFSASSETGTLDTPQYQTNEIRLSSIRGDRFWDYDIGYYGKRSQGVPIYNLPVFLSGAFGQPEVAVPGEVTVPVDRYVLQVDTDIPLKQVYDSYYGNLIFHLTDQTEISGGLRYIEETRRDILNINRGAAANGLPQSILPGGLPCDVFAAAGLVQSPVYPDTCDFLLQPVSSSETLNDGNDKQTKTIYNVSLSHRFTDEILAYTTVGTSWRSGLPALGNTGLPEGLSNPDPEEATSYEIGVKANPLPWLQFNTDIFLIDYKGQLTQFQGVDYYNSVTGETNQTTQAFFENIDAQVQGFEAELTALLHENLTVDANLSYAKIKSEGGQVPCNDTTRPITADNPLNYCAADSGTTINAAPPWQAAVNANYTHQLGPVDGYFRVVANYQGHNQNFGASEEEADAYTLVNLYAGVTGEVDNGSWEIGIYSKNVFDKTAELTSLASGDAFYPEFGPTGYNRVTATLPREVGLSVRYDFGSR
jgi:iron complex outermembrane receptor protein